MVTILRCQNRKTLFEKIPELLHGRDPNFVPPFPGSIRKIFGPRSPFLTYGELHPFIALRDGEPVGRICAIINHRHNEYYRDKIAFFGFFDSVDDPAVAQLLFNAVESQVKGYRAIRGPFNPSINDECGLLVEGFDSPPFVMMPYNPPYYQILYDQIGLRPVRDLYAYYMSASLEAPERIQKIVERVKQSTGLELRNIRMNDLHEELKVLCLLYNRTLDRNWGFVPITIQDLEFTAEELKAIVDPDLILIAEKNGEPAGFSLAIPNINEFLLRARNSRGLLRILKFVWYLKTSHPRQARLTVLGVLPEYRNMGIAAFFFYETLMRGKKRYIGGELSWIEESNGEIMKGITLMGGKRYKTYRIFEKGMESS